MKKVNISGASSSMVIVLLLLLGNVSHQGYAAILDDKAEQCSLYMAPSSIPNAGLGIYTAKALARGTPIGEYDMYIPILDKFKTLPYKGQHRFLSWLGYVWPEAIDTFYPTYNDPSEPELPQKGFGVDDGLNAVDEMYFYDLDSRRVSAFSPGIASLANSHSELVNMYVKSQTANPPPNPGQNDEPLYAVQFESVRNIPAGSELFLFYGTLWNERYEQVQASDGKFRPLVPTWEDHGYTMDNMFDEAFRRNDWSLRKDTEKMLETLRTIKLVTDEPEKPNQMKRQIIQKEKSVTQEKQKSRIQGEIEVLYKEDDHTDFCHGLYGDNLVDYDEFTSSIKQQQWLQANGVCIDGALQVGQSQIPNAGRGAFAKTKVSRGSVIAISPLLALKKDDMVIRKAIDGSGQFRAYLDQEVVGYELLLNYCFGHKDSPVLLVPFAPTVNFINHNREKANVKIQWPQGNEPSKLIGRNPQEWLDAHPLDVIDQSGKLMLEYVALRDLEAGEEIYLDYGQTWEDAWHAHVKKGCESNTKDALFRHEIGVPNDFYPDTWLHQSVTYEVADFEPLQPGELVPLTWKHNGKPVAEYAYAIGLPKGFSGYFEEYIDRNGIRDIYEKLLLAHRPILSDDAWFVFNTTTDRQEQQQEWFAHSFQNSDWKFNMHYVAAWNEAARQSFLGAMGEAGFGRTVLPAIADHLGGGLDNMTCFHASFMGATECENSRRHSDVYETGGKGFNIIWPVVLVNGSRPELDIISSYDLNIEVAVNYKEDVAYVLSDYGYHKTSANSYGGSGDIRIVAGTYCAQVDETNRLMLKHIYIGEIVAPFIDQFDREPMEIHWSKDGSGAFPKGPGLFVNSADDTGAGACDSSSSSSSSPSATKAAPLSSFQTNSYA